MSEENIKPEEKINLEETKTSAPEEDLSKVKVRHVLSQRIKKYGAKKIIGAILLAAVFFCAGFLTDRLIVRYGTGSRFYGRPGIQRNMPGNFNGRGFRNNNGNSNKLPSQNQSQGSTQTSPQTPSSSQ